MTERIRTWVQHDFPASIVVFLVALPLCMGIAVASGVPPAAGLITGIVGGILVGLIAGSPLQVSGPAAGLAVLVWELIEAHGLVMLGPIVLISGILQLLAARLGMGRWFRAISPAVVYGMLAGIGVLIFASQFHVMVDDAPKGTGIQNLLAIPEAIIKGVTPSGDGNHHIAASIGLATIATLVLWAHFRPRKLRAIPPPLIAAMVAVGLGLVLNAEVQYVSVPDNLVDAVRWPTLSTLQQVVTSPELLGAAAAMAFIASAETLLCTGAIDRMQDHVKADYNKELTAQGVGNAVCGALGALPMTGVIVRSSANVDAGARTRASAITHGVWLLVPIALMPDVLRVIPTAGLAAILVYTGYKLVSPAHMRELRQYGWSSLGIYGATIAGIVGMDLLKGVLLGVGLSILRLLYRVAHLAIDVKEDPEHRRIDVHLDGSATFLGLPKLAAALENLPPANEIHVHIDTLRYIDHACLVVLSDWEKYRQRQGTRVVLEWKSLDARSDKVKRLVQQERNRAESKELAAE